MMVRMYNKDEDEDEEIDMTGTRGKFPRVKGLVMRWSVGKDE